MLWNFIPLGSEEAFAENGLLLELLLLCLVNSHVVEVDVQVLCDIGWNHEQVKASIHCRAETKTDAENRNQKHGENTQRPKSDQVCSGRFLRNIFRRCFSQIHFVQRNHDEGINEFKSYLNWGLDHDLANLIRKFHQPENDINNTIHQVLFNVCRIQLRKQI